MRTHIIRFIAILLLSTPIHALRADGKSCPMPNDEITGQVRSFMNNINKIAVEFEQTDTRGGSANGMLIIDKPHKFRCNYYAPFPLLIVGNKNYVSVYDYEMEHFTRIKAEENLFNFMLLNKGDFADQFEVLSQKETPSSYELTIYHEDMGRTSKIGFGKNSGQIEKIVIYEDNNEITIKFGPTRYLSKASANLFKLQDPEIFGVPKRLTKKDIDKLVK